MMMATKEALAIEQKYVDTAVDAREQRRQDRASGKYNIKDALIRPINTMAGESVEELRELGESDEEACFGYVLDEIEGKQYIGKHLITSEQHDVLVCSWRSEMGGKYYVANYRKPAGLIGKCFLIHKVPNTLKDLEEIMFKELAQKVQNLTREPESDVSDAVLDELNRESTGSLKEIVKTIHASQYDIISAPRRGLHVVQGAPGTGKTVVGVHRASWLLYPGNDAELKAEKLLIVGPNITFIKYIEKVVPGLGDDKVSHRDLSMLGPKVSVSRTEDPEISRLKGDLRMKRLLTQALRDRLRIPQDNVIYTVPGLNRSIELSAEGLASKLEEFRAASMTYNAARANLKLWLLNSVNEILRTDYERQKPGVTRGAPFVKEGDVESLTEKIWPSTTAAAFLREFFGSQGRIISAALHLDFMVRDLSLLERRPSAQISTESWSLADVALLDFLEAQIVGQGETFEYLVVDEAQDMSPMQIESIRRRSSTGDILLLGDMAQGTGSWIYESWEDIAELLGSNISRLDELEFGYRVPKQIFDYAARVLTYIDPNLKSPRLVRDVPDSPKIVITSDYKKLFTQLISDLATMDISTGLIGIIAADDQCEIIADELKSAQILFNNLPSDSLGVGVNLVPVSRQKGLEFDSVILIEPQSIIDIPRVGLRQLYVALSRALRSLHIYAIEDLPVELVQTSPVVPGVKAETVKASSAPMPHSAPADPGSVISDIQGYLAVKGLTLSDLLKMITEFLKSKK
jgi:DNA helicase IV